MSSYELLKRAILSKEQVTATYESNLRQFCPHALGWKNGEEHCLGYQFGGQSTTGPIVPGSPHNWRCFAVAKLHGVTIHAGDWHSCGTHGGPTNCLERIDVEVS